jgi:hypothetical protein
VGLRQCDGLFLNCGRSDFLLWPAYRVIRWAIAHDKTFAIGGFDICRLYRSRMPRASRAPSNCSFSRLQTTAAAPFHSRSQHTVSTFLPSFLAVFELRYWAIKHYFNGMSRYPSSTAYVGSETGGGSKLTAIILTTES